MISASGLSRHYPALLGPNKETRAIASLKKAKAAGIQTMLDATTFDLGRDPELLKEVSEGSGVNLINVCLLYTSPSPRDSQKSRMPSSA